MQMNGVILTYWLYHQTLMYKDRKKIDNLWHITAQTDSRIEPIPCGEKQWQEDDSSAIIEIARREGEIVRI
jgi:hypothetical protein